MRHAVVRGPNLTGAGYFPFLTPAHQELLEIGINAGDPSRELPMI
jgi:hypothetical protein